MIVVPVPEIRIIMRIFRIYLEPDINGRLQFNNIGIDTCIDTAPIIAPPHVIAHRFGENRGQIVEILHAETGESRAVAADIVERLVEFPVLLLINGIGQRYRRQQQPSVPAEASEPLRHPLRALRLRLHGDTLRLEEGNVSQRGEAHPCRKTHPQVTACTLRKEQQHAEGHQTATHHEVDARFGQAVFVRAAHHADPEQRQHGQRHKAETVEKPVVNPFFKQLPQRFHGQRRHREPEDQIGHAALGQRPRDEDFGHVEVEDCGVDQQRGGHDVVQQHFEDAAAAQFGVPPAVGHHQEQQRHGQRLADRHGPHRDVFDPRSVEAEDIGRRIEYRIEQPQRDIGEQQGQRTRAQPDERAVDEPVVAHGPQAQQQQQRRQYAERNAERRAFDPVAETAPKRQRHDRRPHDPIDFPPRSAPRQVVDGKRQSEEQRHEAESIKQFLLAPVEFVGEQAPDAGVERQERFDRVRPHDPHGPFAEPAQAVFEFGFHRIMILIIGFAYSFVMARRRQMPRPSAESVVTPQGLPRRCAPRNGGTPSPPFSSPARCAGARPRTASRPPRPRR